MKRGLICLVMFLALMVWADEVIFQKTGEFSVPSMSNQELNFTIAKMPAAPASVQLEFDVRIDVPRLGGYNAMALLMFVNKTAVVAEKNISCPMEFRFANGHTGEPGRWAPPRWNYDYLKTGDFYHDLMLKKGACFFSVVYSNDFDSIDGPQNSYRSNEVSRRHFVFDITSYCKEGENLLTLRNAIGKETIAIMGNKSQLPLIFRDVTIKVSPVTQQRKETFWLKELKDISKEMKVYEPTPSMDEFYDIDVDNRGAVTFSVGSAKYTLRSTYSYPGEGRKNGIPATSVQEKGWKSTIDGMHYEGQGAFYKVNRTIETFPSYVEIRDTLENLTDKPVPVIVRYEIPFTFQVGKTSVWNSGMKLETPATTMEYFPENPTIFVNAPEGSIGMVPADDVLRIHARNYATPGDIQVRDEQLMLSPKKSVTLRLHVFPVVSGDYCTFINHVRVAWELNGMSVRGIYGHGLSVPKADFKPQKGLGTIHVNNHYDGKNRWGLQLAENKALHAQMKEIIAAYKKILPADIPVLANYMAIYFSNADGEDLKRFKECAIVRRDGTYPTEDGCRFYIPTLTNEFGKMTTKTVDMMLDDWKADGIYFDYFEGADPYFTYNQKDGVSCDIDPRTGNLVAEKGSYQLLANDYVIWLADRIRKKGKIIHGNRSHFTWSTMKALKDVSAFRWTECGYPDQLTRGQLAYCPLGLQRTFANDLHTMVLRALYEGMLTSPYDVRYPFVEHPVAYMFPFTYREMRRGCVIGDNKMVTAVSGYFGWGDKGTFICRIFDNRGQLKDENGGVMVTKNGKNYLKVVLQPKEVAVIDRVKPEK